MQFVALDVETANPDMASICQIGLVRCEDGNLLDEWRTYVDPEDYFDDMNVAVHGIGEGTVQGAPKFPDLADELNRRIADSVVVCHTHFDRTALHQASDRYGLQLAETAWLDSARVARRVWNQFAWRGYGLSSVCDFLGYSFRHHDALEDAKAAAHIIVSAANVTGLDLEGLLKRVRQPIESITAAPIAQEGDPNGALSGEIVVFTGALQIPRREAAALAASIGCAVESGVNQKTTLLVVGDQDIRKLAGQEKSSKHRKAEALIAEGQGIRIIKEADFRQLVRFAERQSS